VVSIKHVSWAASLTGLIATAVVGVAFAVQPRKFEGYSGAYTEHAPNGDYQENIDFATTHNGKRVHDFDITFAPVGCGVAPGTVLPPNVGGQVSKRGTFKAAVPLVAPAGINTPTGPVPGSVGHRLATLVVTGKFSAHGMVRGTIKSRYVKGDYPTYTYGHPMGTCNVTRKYSAKASGRALS
jgi:hypothetical protein